MNAQEFELVLNDLETRVDRLRALYENWFRGYEKIEPQVARKDVERRVYALRKELPRNTALRFRYHQLYQRYTTLANYWHRTARQIEEGTYRLQLARMRRRAEQDAPQRRRVLRRERESDGPLGYELNLDESLSIDDLLSDLEMDEVARAVDIPGAHSEPPRKSAPPPRAPRFASYVLRDGEEGPAPTVREAVADSSPPTIPPSPRAAPAAPASPVPPMPAPMVPAVSGVKSAVKGTPAAQPAVEAAAAYPRAVSPAAGPSPPTKLPPTAGPMPMPAEAPTGTLPIIKHPAAAGGPTPAPAEAPTGTLSALNQRAAAGPSAEVPTGTLPGVRRPPEMAPTPAAPAEVPTGTLPGVKRPAPMTSPGSAPAEVPTGTLPGVQRPAATGAPAEAPTGTLPGVPRPGPSGASPGPAQPPTGTVPGLKRPAPAPAAPGVSGAKPAASRPMPFPAQTGGTQVGRPPPPPNTTSTGAAPSEQRLRKLYDEYTAARRRNNEGEVRFDALVTSIQRMLPELQKKHRGKQIDFEVVLKDGRVGLKPKAI